MRLTAPAIIAQLAGLVSSQVTSRGAVSVVTDVIPVTPASGPSTGQFTWNGTGFDAPKVKNLNTTAFDWWYFDVVSPNADYSLVLVFFAATSGGLWPGAPGPSDLITWADLSITLPDGSSISSAVVGEEYAIATVNDGSSGVLGTTGWAWTGSSDMSKYNIAFLGGETGVEGTITFASTSPAHLPCIPISAATPGASFTLSPNFGWANAVPDAVANVNLVVNGTQVKFSGAGYHDKNWGLTPTNDVVKSWYWGHGRLGDLNIVWFDVVGTDGKEYVSSYVSRNGLVLTSSCSGLAVRATGNNTTFPPVSSTEAPAGFHISIDMPGHGVLQVDVAHKRVIYDQLPISMRWIGTIHGGFGNGTILTGPASYEQFTF